jgi:hypothetical protein
LSRRRDGFDDAVEEVKASAAPTVLDNGDWTWKARWAGSSDCANAALDPIRVRNGEISSGIYHHADGPFIMATKLAPNGALYMSANGSSVSVGVKGTLDRDGGKGIIDIGGEIACTGYWTASRK